MQGKNITLKYYVYGESKNSSRLYLISEILRYVY